MSKQHLDWLKSKAGYLKISMIEKELNMPEGTLKKYIDDKRGLPSNWHELVINWIKEFKK
jgi:hypothetical protein